MSSSPTISDQPQEISRILCMERLSKALIKRDISLRYLRAPRVASGRLTAMEKFKLTELPCLPSAAGPLSAPITRLASHAEQFGWPVSGRVEFITRHEYEGLQLADRAIHFARQLLP